MTKDFLIGRRSTLFAMDFAYKNMECAYEICLSVFSAYLKSFEHVMSHVIGASSL